MKLISGEKGPVRRYAVIAIVGGLHALIILIMLAPGNRSERPDEADDPITMMLYFPTPAQVSAPRPRTRRVKPALLMPPALPPPVTPVLPAPITSGTDAPKPVDWMAEGQKAAAAIAAAQGRKDGALAATDPGAIPSQPKAHYAGEQYQLETGQQIAWVSDKCYIIIDPPDPFTPNAFAHHAQARMGCSGASAPRGDLFKQSPTYQKLHPDK